MNRNSTNQADFATTLGNLKQQIDQDLDRHCRQISKSTAMNFTEYSVESVDAYLDIVKRGGKRIRGALCIIGYQMCGGKDSDMILQAASAIELVHAYILVLDDIMDKSLTRRGGRSAHQQLNDYHKNKDLSGDSYHFGESITINSALIGYYYAQSQILKLNADSSIKLRALNLLNNALIVTGHGQINDIFNEAIELVDEASVDRVLEWKTAHYTFLNPLQFGMSLAGASDDRLKLIEPYCMNAGRAFQITDDILGTFGSEQEAGKSPMDDIREGKRTILSVKALQLADSHDKNFLIQMLGNSDITQAEFSRCKEIIQNSGAFEYAQNLAISYVNAAQQSLAKINTDFDNSSLNFLSDLCGRLVGRTN